MRNFDFYRTAALAVGAMLAASVAVISCKKDETTPAPITTEALKHLPDNVGYYGSVKKVTASTYQNNNGSVLTPNQDSSDVLLASGEPYSQTITTYDNDGYTISEIQKYFVEEDCTWSEDYSSRTCNIRVLTKDSENQYTYDSKHRMTEQRNNRYLYDAANNRDTVYRTGSSVTTYTYDDAAKKVTAIQVNGFGVEQYKTEYGMDAEGFIDDNNSAQYPARRTEWSTTPSEVSKTDYDAKGNVTRTRRFAKMGNYFQIYDYKTYVYEY
jgi:hypothetical protein